MDIVTLTLAKKYLDNQKGAENGVASIVNGALVLPSYTTALRPEVSVAGSIIFDSTLGYCILWDGSTWVNLDGSMISE